jgi:hypothetical protein
VADVENAGPNLINRKNGERKYDRDRERRGPRPAGAAKEIRQRVDAASSRHPATASSSEVLSEA